MNVFGLRKHSFVTAVIKLAAFYLLAFFCIRLIFCLFNVPGDNNEPIADYAYAFFMGVRFDILVTAFILMLPAFILFLHQTFFPENRGLIRGIKIYFLLISTLVFFIACANIPYYSQFGSHINESVLVWRLTPGYTLGLIFSSFYYWGFSLFFLLFFGLFVYFLRRLLKEYLQHAKQGNPSTIFVSIVRFLFLGFLLFAGARGRMQRSPMHEGMAIIGNNAFLNQLALNPNFTLGKSLGRKKENVNIQNLAKELRVCRKFYTNNYFPVDGILKTPISPTTAKDSINKLNVIVVLMESLSMAKMGYYHNTNLSPNLTALAKESVFFDRFFSSGIHTFNGLFSSTSGFPSIGRDHGLRQDTKMPFITLGNLLKPYGYSSYFCVTHDPVFDNMEGFFKLNGFDRTISSNDIERSKSLGVTGVPDHVLYEKLVETFSLHKKSTPFVAYVMTGSDHGPWIIPDDIPFKPLGKNEKENASLYADWAVKQFLDEAKKRDWYENTVFVFTGDHGQIMYDVYEMPITYHHVPLIIHCPKLLKPQLNHNLGYQPDIVKTVASLLKVNYKNFSMGENMFTSKRPFVFFSADDKLGYVTDDDFFFYHLLSTGQKKFVKYKTMSGTNYYESSAHRADSLYKVMQSLYNSSRYIIHRNFYNF